MKSLVPQIFAIDDDIDILRIIELDLKELAVNLNCFQTATQFLEEIKTHEPNLCLVDLNLDEGFGAGFQIVRALRNKFGPVHF